ncbi:glucose 1-dehydrogenase [Paraburkholderia hospita]|uniref:Glucose 1-dehydrogenase n=1 Tax=Paraburkholderia hospita TaxID=169430 RepID=A0ABN0FRX7_9BURK|nr:glucose 1-dehydrogenase [Paraburkholderia hospita]
MQPTAAVVGVGSEEGLGAAVARRFARGGFHVLVGGRTIERLERVVKSLGEGNGTPVLMDASREADVLRLFQVALSPGAGRSPASVVVFNAGNNQHIPLQQVSAAQFEDFWRVGCFAGFLVGREAANLLAAQW